MKSAKINKHAVAPHFELKFTHQSHYKVVIIVHGEEIHRILDMDNFYNCFGYTEDKRKTEYSFDQHIQEEFLKDSSIKSAECFQAKLIEYLIKYSDTFMKKYAREYQNWLGKCSKACSKKVEYCATCKLHPLQNEQEYLDF